jgi:hypothetical protein
MLPRSTPHRFRAAPRAARAAAALLCCFALAASPARIVAAPPAGCGPGGVAPGGGAPYACASTAPLPAGVRLWYTVDREAGLLRVALSTPGRGWVALAWTRAQDAGKSARLTHAARAGSRPRARASAALLR